MHFTGGNRTGKERQDGQADRQDRQSVIPRENTRHDNDEGHREETDRQTDRVGMTDRQRRTGQSGRQTGLTVS